MLANTPLSIWTLYHNAPGHRGGYVAKRWVIAPVPTATDEELTADTLDEIRSLLPPGLYRMNRNPGDAPEIVETWL